MKFSITDQLLLTSLVVIGTKSFQTTAEVVLTKEQVDLFVEEQFSLYFTDCEAFAKTFNTKGNNFEYCDFAPPNIKANPKTGCVKKADELIQICEETQGNPTIIYQLEAKPAFTGSVPDYREVAIKGFQKVFGVPFSDPTIGDVSSLDLCFDLVIVESLEAAPGTDLGVQSTYWKGYFTTELCGIPSLPPCKCDDGSLSEINRYNF